MVFVIRKFRYALCGPKGGPISLHTSVSQAIGYYASTRKPQDIILDEASRQRIFAALKRNKYAIRRCEAWASLVGPAIVDLPPERPAR